MWSNFIRATIDLDNSKYKCGGEIPQYGLFTINILLQLAFLFPTYLFKREELIVVNLEAEFVFFWVIS